MHYDDNGNLTTDGTYKYYYDCENRLTDVNTVADEKVTHYEYDYSGRRISKLTTNDQRLTTYCYDDAHIIAEYENGTLRRKYVYGPGIDFPIMMIAVDGAIETRYYYFRDALGSIVALLNNIGNVVEAYSYDPFGKPAIHTAAGPDGFWLTSDDSVGSVSSVANCFMFTARQWDAETGLYYYRARMYHPQIGRFLQPDPIGYYDSMNLYQYCLNNPVNFVDPYGEDIMITGKRFGHQRIEIGSVKDRKANDAWSLAARSRKDIAGGSGVVFRDTHAGEGKVFRYLKTTPEFDEFVKKVLGEIESLSLSDPKAFPYFPGICDCRWFSSMMFEEFVKLRESTPKRCP